MLFLVTALLAEGFQKSRIDRNLSRILVKKARITVFLSRIRDFEKRREKPMGGKWVISPVTRNFFSSFYSLKF